MEQLEYSDCANSGPYFSAMRVIKRDTSANLLGRGSRSDGDRDRDRNGDGDVGINL